MRLRGISIDVVRNEYEYNKYVDAEYRKKYSYEESKPSLPWVIIRFEKANNPEDLVSKSILSFSPSADFTGINAAPDNEWSAGSDKTKLNMDLQKLNKIMFEAKKDLGFSALPANFTAIVEDNAKNVITAEYKTIDLSNKAEVLKNIDEQCLQQGEGYLAQLIYELIAIEKI